MTRVLRRPMFRMGGNTDQGIMSGVVPRQGYVDARLVEQLPELQKIAKQYSYRPTGYTPAQGLIDFGLNLASAEPKGSIFATAAESAKKPFEKYTTGKAEAGLQRYASESDLFKSLIEAQSKIYGSEGGSKIFSKQQAANAMSDLLGQWQTLRDKQDTMDPKDFADQKADIWGQIMQYQRENPAISSLFKDSEFAESVKSKLKKKLKNSSKEITTPDGVTMTEQQYYAENPEELMMEVGRRYIEYYNDMMTLGGGAELKATGGRVGYEQGKMVEPSDMNYPMPKAEPSGMNYPMPKAETMPEELSGISYEELRARLPQEVTDDVVHLLANSKEALEDFATIRTEQDVANFNKKYGVNLVLPAEG